MAIREFAKQENGSMGWSSNMIGVFKLKREKGDGDAKKLARRVLVRQDPGGRVLFVSSSNSVPFLVFSRSLVMFRTLL